MRVENFETGEIEEEEYDMVVLAIGLMANPEIAGVIEGLELDPFSFVMQKKSANPAETNISGVFVAGCAAGPKDIPDTIAEANAAASQCMAYLAAQEVVQ